MNSWMNKSWDDYWCIAHNHLDSEWSCEYTRDYKAYPALISKAALFVKPCHVDITFAKSAESD